MVTSKLSENFFHEAISAFYLEFVTFSLIAPRWGLAWQLRHIWQLWRSASAVYRYQFNTNWNFSFCSSASW